MRRVCFYHAGCPDGFGAAWAVWKAWGDAERYLPLGHGDLLHPEEHVGGEVAFVDIAIPNQTLRELAELAERVVVLDHHVSARDRFEADPALVNELRGSRHHVEFDLSHSGAMLAWRHFHPGTEPPALLRYVEDQDLWTWKLPDSEPVNAAIGSHPQDFEVWSELAATPIEALAREGEPILRSQRGEVQLSLRAAHPVTVGSLRAEAVNAVHRRSPIGHELAKRAAFGHPCGVVYRLCGDRVDVSIYSIGDLDVARIAAEEGGGGHRNAAGFQVTLREWLERFV